LIDKQKKMAKPLFALLSKSWCLRGKDHDQHSSQTHLVDVPGRSLDAVISSPSIRNLAHDVRIGCQTYPSRRRLRAPFREKGPRIGGPATCPRREPFLDSPPAPRYSSSVPANPCGSGGILVLLRQSSLLFPPRRHRPVALPRHALVARSRQLDPRTVFLRWSPTPRTLNPRVHGRDPSGRNRPVGLPPAPRFGEQKERAAPRSSSIAPRLVSSLRRLAS
jgi:hypothetical protein